MRKRGGIQFELLNHPRWLATQMGSTCSTAWGAAALSGELHEIASKVLAPQHNDRAWQFDEMESLCGNILCYTLSHENKESVKKWFEHVLKFIMI